MVRWASLAEDVLYGTLLGQNALILTLITFLVLTLQQLWLNAQDLWGALDEHPLLHASLGLLVLLVVALLLGRVARYLILHAVKLLGRQPALHWLNDLRHNKVFHRLAQMTPSLVIQFGLYLVPDLSKTAILFIGNVALALTILFLVLAKLPDAPAGPRGISLCPGAQFDPKARA